MSSDPQEEVTIETNINNALQWARKNGFAFVVADLVEAYDGDFVAAIRAALRFITAARLSDEDLAERCMYAVVLKLYESDGGI